MAWGRRVLVLAYVSRVKGIIRHHYWRRGGAEILVRPWGTKSQQKRIEVWCGVQNPGLGRCRMKKMWFLIVCRALFCFPCWIKSVCSVGCQLKACEIWNVNSVGRNNINYEMSVLATIGYDKKSKTIPVKTDRETAVYCMVLCLF